MNRRQAGSSTGSGTWSTVDEPAGPTTRNGGRRGNFEEAWIDWGIGAGNADSKVKDLASLRFARVGAKWRRKHAELLLAVHRSTDF